MIMRAKYTGQRASSVEYKYVLVIAVTDSFFHYNQHNLTGSHSSFSQLLRPFVHNKMKTSIYSLLAAVLLGTVSDFLASLSTSGAEWIRLGSCCRRTGSRILCCGHYMEGLGHS